MTVYPASVTVRGTKPLLALSNLIVDDITFPDGRVMPRILGGAGLYAATGAAIWWPRTALVAGVGDDLPEVSDAALPGLGLLANGLLRRSPHTIRSSLTYRADGSRTEIPIYGPEHFETMQLSPDDIPDSLLPAEGTYLFQPAVSPWWDAVETRRDALGTLFWEICLDARGDTDPRDVKRLCPGLDMVSLNRAEAKQIFRRDDPERNAATLLNWGCQVAILRLGEEGSLVITRSARIMVRPPEMVVTDVTGAGNAFCGGFLGAWCAAPGDVEGAARRAAVSAARAIGQFGPADPRDRQNLDPLLARTWVDGVDRHADGANPR